MKFVHFFLPIRGLPYSGQLPEAILTLYSVLQKKELTSASKLIVG